MFRDVYFRGFILVTTFSCRGWNSESYNARIQLDNCVRNLGLFQDPVTKDRRATILKGKTQRGSGKRMVIVPALLVVAMFSGLRCSIDRIKDCNATLWPLV